MILRRLSRSLKQQNWTAIWIEFILLVVGVFLGIQVANWNEDRKSRLQERELLQRLRIEINQNIDSAQEKARFFETVYASADRAYAFLSSDASCEPDCWQHVVDLFYASQWRDMRPARDAYDELERLGYPRETRLKIALTTYYGLYESMVTVSSELPEIRTKVRSFIPPKTQLYLWRTCHRIKGLSESLATSCPAIMSESESREIMEQLRADPTTRSALAYWMSTVALLRPALDQQIAGAQAVSATIASEIEN